MSVLTEITENYLVPYMRAKWRSVQIRPEGSERRRFPFVVEEAALITALTSCIGQYMNTHGDSHSTLVSEAQVRRTYNNNGYCDIVWISDEITYYIELKGVLWERNFTALNEAIKQVYSITDCDNPWNKTGNQTQNEFYYGYTPRKRIGFVAEMLFIDVKDSGESNEAEIMKWLEQKPISLLNAARANDADIVGQFYIPILFDGPLVDTSWYDEKKLTLTEKRSNGFFLIGAEFIIDGIEPEYFGK